MRVICSVVLLTLLQVAVPTLRLAGQTAYLIETVGGGGGVREGESALSARFTAIGGISADASGNLYISDSQGHRIRRVMAATETVETVAGDGSAGDAGDGGPSAAAQLNQPYGTAVDSRGAVYFADFLNRRVRRITPEGLIETVAGGGRTGGAPALAIRLSGPRNLAVDRQGNFFISDFSAHRVYRINPAGGIESVAGIGFPGYTGDGDAAAAPLNGPAGLAVGEDGSLYIADSGNGCVRVVRDGKITTVLGRSDDSPPLATPTGLALDPFDSLYVADPGAGAVYRLSPDGEVQTLLQEAGVRDVAVGPLRIFIAGERTVKTLDRTGNSVLYAGSDRYGPHGDGVAATETTLDGPIGLGLDIFGNLLVVEEPARRIRKINANGKLFTVAVGGAGTGPPHSEELLDPVAAAGDRWGRIWIADYLGHRIHCVQVDGTIKTIAGTGEQGFSGDHGPARLARLNRPRGVAVDQHGNVYVSDSGNHRIRRINPEGNIDTVAGNGGPGSAGDFQPGLTAAFDTPAGLWADSAGGIYIADRGSHQVRYLRSDGFVIPVAGNGLPGFSGDGGPARKASLHAPTAVSASKDGSVWIADTANHRVRRVDPEGVITTIAGAGTPGYGGDGGDASFARLHFPSGIVVREEYVFVADLDNNRVRRIARVIAPPMTDPGAECTVVHGATFAGGTLAPGQIATIFGSGIGPKEAAFARIGASGTLAANLAGVEVRFNGRPAPLFYAGTEQANVQVPSGLTPGEPMLIDVFYSGAAVCRAQSALAEAAPGFFTLSGGAGHAVALNQDGALNSPDQPAARGSVVTLYATGEGLTDPPAEDGKPASAPLPRPLLPVQVRLGGAPVEVLYAGAAPGYAGLMQVNIRVPSGFFPSGDLSLEMFVGSHRSQSGVFLSVR